MEEKKQLPNRQLLVEMGYEESVVFENPDFDKMAESMMEEDGLTYEEAVEFIDYNTIRALPYIPGHPIVMYNLQNEG